jgi:predicted methyltransferase
MQKHALWGIALLCAAGISHAAPATPAYIAAAVADKARPAADIARDQDGKPAELIALAGIKPGDRVADLMPGGGYFTRLFSKVVGPKGHVYAVLPASLANQAPPEKLQSIRALADAPGYRGNTSLDIRPYDRLDLGAPLDVVWTSQNYHDVYGAVRIFHADGHTGPEEAAQLDAAVFKALKPGGTYIVIDHAAEPGANEQSANSLHRIDPAKVIEQAQAAGFVLEERSEMLGNPQDGHDKSVFAPEIHGHTDKFVLKFRKP